MISAGVIRRIDDLGRIVIPKEIRKTVGIQEGDPLEIFTDKNNNLVLKKYAPTGEELYSNIFSETLDFLEDLQLEGENKAHKKYLIEKINECLKELS